MSLIDFDDDFFNSIKTNTNSNTNQSNLIDIDLAFQVN